MLAKCTSARDNHVLACNSARYLPIEKNFTDSAIILNLVINNPVHLKYVATLPCNLSSLACFGDINVSQGSVATYARCGGIFNIHLTANLSKNLTGKKFLNWLRIDRIMVMSLWPPWPSLYIVTFDLL